MLRPLPSLNNMATLIPSYRSNASRMTSGERRLAQRLEANLEEDYLLWYDVPVGSKRLHPDFIVLHPSRGIFVLEVKDWKLDTIQAVIPKTLRSPHPLVQKKLTILCIRLEIMR